MERVVLDDDVIHLRECGRQELFAGGERAAAVFLFDSGCQGVRDLQAIVQFPADAGDEPGECGAFLIYAG